MSNYVIYRKEPCDSLGHNPNATITERCRECDDTGHKLVPVDLLEALGNVRFDILWSDSGQDTGMQRFMNLRVEEGE
jgi:hypothetical protein